MGFAVKLYAFQHIKFTSLPHPTTVPQRFHSDQSLDSVFQLPSANYNGANMPLEMAKLRTGLSIERVWSTGHGGSRNMANVCVELLLRGMFGPQSIILNLCPNNKGPSNNPSYILR